MRKFGFYDIATGDITCCVSVSNAADDPVAPNADVGVIPIPDNSCDDTTHCVDINSSPHKLMQIPEATAVNASVALNIQT